MSVKKQKISLSKHSLSFPLRVGKNGVSIPECVLNHLRLIKGDFVVANKAGMGRHGTFITIRAQGGEFGSGPDCCPCYLCEKARRWREKKLAEGLDHMQSA